MKLVSLSILFALSIVSASVAVESAGIPKVILDQLEYRVGTWESTLLIDGVEQPGKNREVTEWAAGGKYATGTTQCFVEDGATRNSVGVSGWNPERKQLVEHWHVSDGAYGGFYYKIDKEKGAWVGTFRYIEPSGKRIEGKSVVEKKSNDEWIWKGSWVEDGKERTRSAVNHRVK